MNPRLLLCLRALRSGPVHSHLQVAGSSTCRRSFSLSASRCTASRIPRIGQPTFETHPHLLKEGELTPGLSAIDYAVRRARLAYQLPEGAVAIIPSAYLKYRSGPVFYDFHQDPDFFYLTGFLEPDSIAVIEKTGPEGEHVFHLFLREKDAYAELWDGARTGVQGAIEYFNADKAYDILEAPYRLRGIIEDATSVYVNPTSPQRRSGFLDFVTPGGTTKLDAALQGKHTPGLKKLMHELRVMKSGEEAAVMRKAGKMSGRAFTKAMGEDFVDEKELANFLDYNFKMNGCDGSAYVPVVGGGVNALSIHYTNNNEILNDGEMVLVDAGGHYGGYMTDITRTWPNNGKFTDAQRDLYTAVLNVQRECVKLCIESKNLSLNEIHRFAERGLHDQLKQLGFDLAGGGIRDLFPHHVGHFVGIDLHDCATFSKDRKLQAGHVVTIEPGVYIPNDEKWPAHFRGMGIRIEDSVFVGEKNPVVLTVEAVKEIDDIEALRA